MGFSFGIETPSDFLRKLTDEYRDYCEAPLSSRHAINCAMTAYHMIDWVWGGTIKPDAHLRQALGVNDIKAFRSYVLSSCPSIKVLRAITNGSKHFRTDKDAVKSTSQEAGWDNSAWDTTPWDSGFLKIDMVDGTSVSFESVAKNAIDYWQDFFTTNIHPKQG